VLCQKAEISGRKFIGIPLRERREEEVAHPSQEDMAKLIRIQEWKVLYRK